jgi:hypothetical protein
MAKVKAAYATRPRYHPAAQSSMAPAQEPPVGHPLREGARPPAPAQSQQNKLGRIRSLTKREGVEDESIVNARSADDHAVAKGPGRTRRQFGATPRHPLDGQHGH